MINELKKDYSVLDYNDFNFNYGEYKYIVFFMRLSNMKDISNICLIVFEKFLFKSPSKK